MVARGLARAVARHYPLLPYRRRVPWLNGVAAAIPAGEIVRTRTGVLVRVMPDETYFDVYFWGDYEPYNTKIYRRLIRPGDVVFDVGANFGWFSTLFARWVTDSGRVHSFEPVPFITALTEETLSVNGVRSRVELNPFALGQEEGNIPVFTHTGLPHSHATAADLGRSDAIRHDCRVRRLDDYCDERKIRSFRFMKVDVEGYERDVFMGGKRVLSGEGAPIIAFELSNDCLRQRSLGRVDVVTTLRELGYTAFFSFSTRTGIKPLDMTDAEGTVDCLAAQPARLDELRRTLSTGRLLR